MFGIKGIGSTTKPREFNYSPIYWNQEAEERAARRRELRPDEQTTSDEQYEPGSMIRESRIRRMRHAEQTHSKSRVPIIRAVIFLGLVVAVLYIMTTIFGKLVF